MYSIYGLKWCIFCLRAINLMQEQGIEFHYYPLDNQEKVLEYINESYGHKTVPIIIKNTDGVEVLIGGYDDLVKHIRKQEDEESD